MLLLRLKEANVFALRGSGRRGGSRWNDAEEEEVDDDVDDS
jgi:hypothetical protein